MTSLYWCHCDTWSATLPAQPTFRPFWIKEQWGLSVWCRIHMENSGRTPTCMRRAAVLSLFNTTFHQRPADAALAAWELAWQPHPSLPLLWEARSDERQLTGTIELYLFASSRLHPLRALKGSFLKLIAGRWMWRRRRGPPGCPPPLLRHHYSISNFIHCSRAQGGGRLPERGRAC